MLNMQAAKKFEKGYFCPNLFMFEIPFNNQKLTVVASDCEEDDNGIIWEHVSVSLKKRLPTWDELKFIKLLFWDAEDEVIQFFPPQSEYVNLHENCLHLWRPRCELPWRKS